VNLRHPDRKRREDLLSARFGPIRRAQAVRAIDRRRKIDFAFAELRARQEAQNIHV
jgi:hypothetical protein